MAAGALSRGLWGLIESEGENSRGRKKQMELLGSNSESRTVGSISSIPSLGGQSSEDNSQGSEPQSSVGGCSKKNPGQDGGRMRYE